MAEASGVLELATRLIREPSVSPADGTCQQILATRLAAAGFAVEHLPFGKVANLWAVHGTVGPLLVFAGHTDVVPPGDRAAWQTDPFEPTVKDGFLHGRGAADMKGSLAAMIVAAESFAEAHPRHPGRMAFLITSDEEADAVDGTVRVVEELARRGIRIDWCVVGEPTCETALGDTIKIGRRGSLNARLDILGIQGHVAYPDVAENPIHAAAPVIAALASEKWDEGNEAFPPTRLQVTNIASGTGATNVVPGRLTLRFNLRFSPESTVESIRRRTEQILLEQGVRFELDWQLSGLPFQTTADTLAGAVERSIAAVTGRRPARSTSGGTSDGRFIAPSGAEVVEFGPINATIHKANERIRVDELEHLVTIHKGILEELLS